jgi:carboxyl-terminal processing protease
VGGVIFYGSGIRLGLRLPFVSTTPKELVDEAWKIVDNSYVDPTFNQVDWQAVRQDFLAREYGTYEEAYLAIRDMLDLLEDPYTKFMDPDEFRNMEIDSSGALTGVGIRLRQDEETKKLVVVSLIQDAPAFQAGILAKDVIIKINDHTTEGMDMNQAVALIRGIVGTDVTLMIRRGDQELEFKLQRARIELYPVTYLLQDSTVGKVGYIRLKDFSINATEEMRGAIQDLERQQATGYILDLRSNPGGQLDVGIEIARMWLNEGVIVSIVDKRGIVEPERANRSALTDKPLVVLVNDDSASVSEILAGALQVHERATIVGSSTFGKLSVVGLRELSDGKSAVLVRSAKYLLPDGRDIERRGVIPNIELLLTTEQKELLMQDIDKLGTSNDPQFVAALNALEMLFD